MKAKKFLWNRWNYSGSSPYWTTHTKLSDYLIARKGDTVFKVTVGGGGNRGPWFRTLKAAKDYCQAKETQKIMELLV